MVTHGRQTDAFIFAHHQQAIAVTSGNASIAAAAAAASALTEILH